MSTVGRSIITLGEQDLPVAQQQQTRTPPLPPLLGDFSRQLSHNSEQPLLDADGASDRPALAMRCDTSETCQVAEPTLRTPSKSLVASQGSPSSSPEELLLHMQKQMLVEVTSMHSKLDGLAAHINLLQSSPKAKFALSFPAATKAVPDQQAGGTTSEAVRSERIMRARSKIRALGAIIAAGKRRSQDSGDDPSRDTSALSNHPSRDASALTTPSSTPRCRRPSVAVSNASRHSLFANLYDEESADRLRHIQKALQLHTRGRRHKVWQFTESAYSSRAAFAYAGLWKLIVVVSVLIAFLHASSIGADWHVGELVFESLFGLEFSLRFLCCPSKIDFMISFFNWIDLISFAPLFLRLSLLIPSDSGSLLALVPFLRLLKLMRWFEKLHLLLAAFERALEALPSLFYTMAVLALCFAEALYLVEPTESIQSLTFALWFTIVSMCTVGYGDYTPDTDLGKMVTSVLIVTSTLYMAMPLGIVGNAFSEVWADRDRLLVIKRFRSAFLEGGFTLQAFQDIFAIFDGDGNGGLDVDEFSLMLNTIQMNMSQERVQMLFAALDKDGSGEIELGELVAALVPKSFAHGQFDFDFATASKSFFFWRGSEENTSADNV